jgi:hypothetical protein
MPADGNGFTCWLDQDKPDEDTCKAVVTNLRQEKGTIRQRMVNMSHRT